MKDEAAAIEAEVEQVEAKSETFHAHNPELGKHVRMSCTDAEWKEWEKKGWVRG